jgi:hypothetical protein
MIDELDSLLNELVSACSVETPDAAWSVRARIRAYFSEERSRAERAESIADMSAIELIRSCTVSLAGTDYRDPMGEDLEPERGPEMSDLPKQLREQAGWDKPNANSLLAAAREIEEFEALRDAIAAAPTAKNEIGQFDKGPWKVGTNNGLPSVYSDDFTHDVVLAISGNFESKAQHQAYAEALAARLNCDSQYSSEVRQSPVVAAVLDEVRRATEKFPTWPTDPLHAVAVLGEEFGELTKAALQLTYEPHKTTADEVRTEAIQTAAMALRFAMSLGVYLYQPGAQHAQQTACPAQSKEVNP